MGRIIEQEAKLVETAPIATTPRTDDFGARFTQFNALPARVVRTAQWVLIGMAAIILALTPWAPSSSEQAKWIAFTAVAAFIVVAALTFLFSDKHPELAFTVMIGAGVVVCATTMMQDETSAITSTIALFLGIVAITLVHGVRGGLIIAGVTCGIICLATFAGPATFSGFDVIMLSVMEVAVVLVVDGITRDRRRIAGNLTRLYEALRASAVDAPDLGSNLDVVVQSITQTAGAAMASVLLIEDGKLEIAAPSEARGTEIADQVRIDLRDQALGGATLAAISEGHPIVVGDLATDTRWPLWREAWAGSLVEFNLRSLVAVPLQTSSGPLGVLVVLGTEPHAFSADDVAVLSAYAEQLALVILRVQAYEREREGAKRLVEADKLKSEFLAMVSHELRTPLTAAKGFVDTVLLHWDRLDDDKRRELLRRASGNASELTRLISQLLDFARIDANRIEIRPLACNIRELVERVVVDLSPVTAERNVMVSVDERMRAMTDPDAFNHVLVNLITNANKFSPVGSTIRIAAEQQMNEIVVSVRDEGVGIAPDELEKVFERFYQSERTNMSRKGTGIGLAIVRRFIEQQGGRIWVESTVGEGSTFRFTLALPDALPPGVSRPATGVLDDAPAASDTYAS
ncbi:MAG: ATP-binding protein [Acidimicrobiia bacterium]